MVHHDQMPVNKHYLQTQACSYWKMLWTVHHNVKSLLILTAKPDETLGTIVQMSDLSLSVKIITFWSTPTVRMQWIPFKVVGTIKMPFSWQNKTKTKLSCSTRKENIRNTLSLIPLSFVHLKQVWLQSFLPLTYNPY